MPNQYINKVVQSNGTTLMDISDTTAVASDVTKGKYFYLANGEKVEGTASLLGATTYNTSTTDQTIASGRYITGTQTIKAVTVSGLDASKILSGTTVMVGDANDADRIASVTGTVTFSTITTSSSNPSGGSNGDIWIKTS